MAFDIQGAMNSGYSTEEIADYLAKSNPKFDVPGAMKAGYSLDEIAKEMNNPEEQPGMLKSAATGLMSGIPGAETVLSGVEALGDKTYDEAHKGWEDLKDKAWEAHPVAYGAGKTAGMVGTGIAAPASIPAAIAVGGISGLDAAKSLAEMPGDALKGAGMGGALGVVGEKVISPLISKVLPAAAKKIVGSMAKGEQNVDTYLANRAGVNNSLTAPQAAEKFTGGLNTLEDRAGALSDTARGLLKSDEHPLEIPIPLPTPKSTGLVDAAGKEIMQQTEPSAESLAASETPDVIKSVIDQVKQNFLRKGVANTPVKRAAISALDDQYQALTEMAKAGGGKLSESDLKDHIIDLQQLMKPSQWDNPDVQGSKAALEQLSGALNGLLKDGKGAVGEYAGNEAYKAAMKPVADLRSVITDAKQTFKPDVSSANGFTPSDVTNQKLSTVLAENKTNAQDLLNKVGDLTGFDFLKNASLNETKQAFDNGSHSNAFVNMLGHALGFGGGALMPFPGSRLVGSLLGGAAAHVVDSGKAAKWLLDSYLNNMEKIADPTIKAAIQKYGPMLVNAAKQGGNQLAATHFVLATSHPEYQKAIQYSQEQEQQ